MVNPVDRPKDKRAPRVFFNGKFYSGGMNGVHRVADRLLRQIDRLAGEGGPLAGWDLRLLAPRDGGSAPAFGHIRTLPQSLGHTQYWEQAVLPLVARSGVLVSLANLAPVAHACKVTMVHDAQFRISPGSYPLKLRLGYRALVPAGARSSRRVLTVSDYARDSLETFGIARRDRIGVIPNSAEHILETPPDPSILDRLGLRARPYCLLFGSVATYKNIAVVLDAFERDALHGIDLVIIGPQIERLVRHGLVPPARARMIGMVSDAELRALYEAASCLAFPSRTEGFGLPPLEAMTCGCPVVAAPAGAIPEICGDAILYAGQSDPADWVRQILRLAADAPLRAAKIAHGRARAGRFTWADAGRRLAHAIVSVAATRN